MVRAVIRELLPEMAHTKGVAIPNVPSSGAIGDRISAAARGGGGTVKVRIASDQDLRAFASALLTCRDAAAQRALVEGTVKLALDRGPGSPGSRPGTARIDRGVVSEARISEIARAHATLTLGKSAVLTPLARDRARAVGLAIVRNTK